MPEVKLAMSEKKRKRGRPRVAPALSYGTELKMRNNIARTIKKPRYLREQDEEDSISRGSTPARSIDNVSVHSKGSVNGKSRPSRGYNPDIDDKDSEYHYGSDFDMEDDSEPEKVTTGADSRSISEVASDLEESDLGDLNIDEGENLGINSESTPNFVPFWKLGPAGTLGYRPHTPVPVWLQDREYPELQLPQSSDDLLMPKPFILQAVGIYEVLRHFRNIVRLSPFHFEDFCASLLMEEQSALVTEIHIAILKSLIREEDSQQTHFGQLDQKDSINISLYFVDSMTWPETLKSYLQSDPEFKSTLEIVNSCNYPFTSLSNRLMVLQFLCDQFLQTSVVREDLLSEGKIRYDDHCRACHKTGDLLCCDSCPAVYHLDCADPPLTHAPLEIEDWTCSVCNKHKLEGVTDCSSLMESSGLMCRQEPLGYDRHGRKYWFLVRRIIIESEEGDVWYFSTLEHLDLLLLMMDSVDLEEGLFVALKEFGDDIRRQMEITEKITEKGCGTRKALITKEMEETRKRIEEIHQEKEKTKQEKTELNTLIEEVKDESVDSKVFATTGEKKELEVGKGELPAPPPPVPPDKEHNETLHDDDVKVEIAEEPLEWDIKPNLEDINPFQVKVKKERVWTEQQLKEMVQTKKEQLRLIGENLYRLGCDYSFRTYVNQFTTNTLTLNKLQHNEERDKKRHLSHKFSLTTNSEFKWIGYSYGSCENQVTSILQTILSVEQNISSHFFHSNWQHVRKSWIQYVGAAKTSQELGKALLWLVACIKPVVFNNVWHESLGHIRLKRITATDREERKKQEKREKKESEEEGRLFPLVKFTKGVKHQLWKVKGEEYRIHGLWGWQWLSSTRRLKRVSMSTVGLRAGPDKINVPIKSNRGPLLKGIPVNPSSFHLLAAQNPSLQFSLLSPNQKREEEEKAGLKDGKEKKKEMKITNAGQLEVSELNLEDYFEDGVVNVSNELNARLRLVYPKIAKSSSLDNFLSRRLTLKLNEEKEFTKGKRNNKEKLKKEADVEGLIDVENDSDSALTDSGNDTDDATEGNIEAIPDSQRRIAIHKQRPAGHLLKEMRAHKFKYEALDKLDETLPCYSVSCRKGGRGSCYSPSCILKERTKQKLINSVNNYKIITSKPAPFDNVGSRSPVRLSSPEKTVVRPEGGLDISGTPKGTSLNGQITGTNDNLHKEREKSLEFRASPDEDSSSYDNKPSFKGEKLFSSEDTSGKIYLKKCLTDTKKAKKHKVPPINLFRVHKNEKDKKDPDHSSLDNPHSLFILPAWEIKVLARRGGKYAPSGFNSNAKINNYFWTYPCPRPVFKITWLYRTTLVKTVNAVASQLRILWACLKWDEMHEKGPADGRKQITTDMEIIQTEILKRKISGRFSERTEYLRRKVTIPLDVPKPVREFTPSQRSGLRKRRRAQSPVNKQPQSIEEWVDEDKFDLWEIRYFGERLEKAAAAAATASTVSKKLNSSDKELISGGNFHPISRSTSPAEFKAKMEEQLKIQRANFNQKKKSLEGKSSVVKVAIGSVIPYNSSSKTTESQVAFSNSKLGQGPTSSIVTVGSKLPSVLSGKKIVTTKGGKIISVQTSGNLSSSNPTQEGPTKISVGKTSVFPVSSLPKVQVTQQGNKVIKLQNISGVGGQRTILPRVVSPTSSSAASLIRPITTTTTNSTNQILQTSTTPTSNIRPTLASQQIQILRTPEGHFQVKGLQDGQQLVQRGDGKLHLVNTKIANSSPTSVSATSQATASQITQQTKPLITMKDSTIRGITPLSGNQILRINGQQVILRTGVGGPNGKQIMSVSAKDTAALSSPTLTTGNVSIPKLKTPEIVPKAHTPLNTLDNTPLLKEKLNPEEKPKQTISSSTPVSPSKGVNSPPGTVSNTMTLRVQVRMTEQGPKTIIQGLQPGVGLTKDHIMAIQQQVRSMLAQYNLQVNQLSPLMTLTLQSTNKAPPPVQNQGVKSHVPQLPSPNQTTTAKTTTGTTLSESKDKQIDRNMGDISQDKTNENVPPSGLVQKDRLITTTSDSKDKFVLTDDYIQQSIESALNKNDLAPDVEEKLVQLQKFTNSKTKKGSPISMEDRAGTVQGKAGKRLRDMDDESDWDNSDIVGSPKSKSNKRVKTEKSKLIGKKDTSSLSPGSSTKAQLQDARKKLARQQKLEGLLSKHKDLLKKDILKKRALLEKELQLLIHKELSVARQQIQSFEKIKTAEPTHVTPSKKIKTSESTTPVQAPSTPRETSKPKKSEPPPPSPVTTPNSATKSAKGNSNKNKKSGKTKSKKIVCICRTSFDDTKFYVGCDLCGNWFHGDCVGITEALSRSMTEYVCDDCANAKLNKDLFCFCKQPYDETQFYICCEKCEDWYHGRCIGIMQAEADDIDDYICPKCEPDNQWNRPCQKKLSSKDYAELKKVAKMLTQHKNAWPFLEPVDQSEVPDYYKVVKDPMDLKLVERKVSQHKYKHLFEFIGDVMLVFDNCRAYNPPNSSFCSCANNLETFFCTKLKQLKLKVGSKS